MTSFAVCHCLACLSKLSWPYLCGSISELTFLVWLISNLCIHLLVQHCLDCCIFVLSLNVEHCQSSDFVFYVEAFTLLYKLEDIDMQEIMCWESEWSELNLHIKLKTDIIITLSLSGHTHQTSLHLSALCFIHSL